jgi:hypothetical protein
VATHRPREDRLAQTLQERILLQYPLVCVIPELIIIIGLHSRWRPIRILPGHHLEATHLYIGIARARGGHQPHQDGADLPLGHLGKPAHGARCEAEW